MAFIESVKKQSGGSGGHIILDNEGTSLTQRDDLQFKGAYSEDDSTNEKTVVNVIRSMTRAEFDELTEAEKTGLINITDESGSADRNYSETTLWSGSETPSTSGTDITLTDDIANYDEIVFCIISESDRKSQESFFVSGLSIGETYLEETYPPESIGVFWVYTSGTSIKLYRISSSSGNAITYTKVLGIKYGNGTQTFHNYSTAEQVVGTWIDGSTVYEKTFTGTSEILNGSWSNIENLSSLDIDTVVNIDGVMRVNEDGDSIYRQYPLGLSFGLMYNEDTKYVMGRQSVLTQTSGKNFTEYCTIKYTKSST